ncbi:MAG: carbon storage regulator CsrA [Eubacteriales bacterium]
MLILNRKIDESIIIDNNIVIKIVELMDGRVKIGIDAPKNITILRKEVYDAVIEENRASLDGNEHLMEIIKYYKK